MSISIPSKFKGQRPLRPNSKSPTLQEPAVDADINVIAARFLKTGVLPNKYDAPQFGDVTAAPDLMRVMAAQAAAATAFELLPERLRVLLDGKPSALAPWLADPRNRPLAEELGLVKPKAVPPPEAPPLRVSVVPPVVEVAKPS